MTSSILIAGAGQAGYQLAASLRQLGFAGAVTLLGDEPGLPYQRPPLSKAYLLGKVGASALQLRPEAFYAQQQIQRVQARITAIDRTAQQLQLADGQRLHYDHLVLAVGARNRLPAAPGAQLGGVLGIRTLADADALSSRLAQARQVVVIGAGFIGLEFAAVAAARGLTVQVLEVGPRAMARAVSLHTSAVFEAAHRAAGVQLHFSEGVAELLGDEHGQVQAVLTVGGRLLPADLVVYGIGVVPNDGLARAAGLTVDNGVRVDGQLRSSDAAISAIGDLASFRSPWASAQQPWVRLESVQNAVDQAKLVAARLAGQPLPDYDALPWFWTDQGALKLQIAGLSDPLDETVMLGDPVCPVNAPAFSVLFLRDGRLAAVESCNRPTDHLAARKLIQRRSALTAAEASAPGFDLKAFELASRPAA